MKKPARELASDSGFGKGYDFAPSSVERAIGRVQSVAKKLVQRVLRASLGTFGQIDTWVHAGQARPSLDPATFHPGRILIIRTDLLGDVVLTLPGVHAIRRAYPDAQIDMVVIPSTSGILTGNPDIDNVITCDPNSWLGGVTSAKTRAEIGKTIRQLRAAHYDLAISMCGDWASIVARLSGARRRVGFEYEAYAHILTDPEPGGRYRVQRHESEYGLALAARAGGIVDARGERSRRPLLPVLDSARESVANLLAQHSIAPEQSVIALHVGSRNGQAKRWPLPSWARLADQLGKDPYLAMVLVGAPGDKPLAQAMLQRMQFPERAIDLTGTTNLPELAALLERCAVVVTGDSGPLHIAEAVDTQVVALHGPTDPVLSGPCGPDAVVLHHTLWCSPCYDSSATAECRFSNPICMKGLGPAEVLAATLAQVAKAEGQHATAEE